MGENDLKDYIADDSVSEEVKEHEPEVVSVDEVYSEDPATVSVEETDSSSAENDMSASADADAEKSDVAVEETDGAAEDSDVVDAEELVSDTSEADSVGSDDEKSEQNTHESNLEGYRAYRKKNILKKSADDSAKKETQKDKKFFDVNSKSGTLIFFACLAVITIFDFFAMNLFAIKQSYSISDKILKALEFNTLHFSNIKYEQICLGVGYFVSFIIGGVVIFILLKIFNKLFANFQLFKMSSACPVIALGIFALIFIIGFMVSYFSDDALLVLSVYRWGAPAAAYLGGLIFYGASKLHVGIEY